MAAAGHVDVHARLREGGKRGRHHHGRRVSHRESAAGSTGDAHLLQKIRQALRRKQRLLTVARAVQAHHQAVADELVVAHAFDRNQLLEPRAGGLRLAPAVNRGRTTRALREFS